MKKIFYKLISLNNLGIYWNIDEKMIYDLKDKSAIRKALKETIATTSKGQPKDFTYCELSDA